MSEKKIKVDDRKKRLIFEIRRKFIHSFAALSIPVYYFFLNIFGHEITMLGFLFVLLMFISIEFFRIVEKKIPIFHLFWRQKEENTLGGQVYFMIGIIIAFAIFEFRIATTIILMTVFGDMAAAIIGISLGKHKIKQLKEAKTWEGVAAEFVVDIFIGFLILKNWFIVIPMALMATFVEALFPHVDDNLAIPVFGGFVGQCLRLILA